MSGLIPFQRIQRTGKREAAESLSAPFFRLAQMETAGGLLLIGATIAALVWANSSAGDGYERLWHETYLDLSVGEWGMHLSLGHWINDLLMAVFFLFVGLEIKRELISGELRSIKKASIPICAAIGGMVVPAAIYTAINIGGDGKAGWGIPMATDIAFALGVLAMLGPGIPKTLMVFLMSLAIVDDLGALLVIAVFYTDDLAFRQLGYAGIVVLGLVALNLLGFRRLWLYLAVGLVLWYFVHKSGVHSTIAGVVLALTIPERKRVHWKSYSEYVRGALDYFEEEAKDENELTGTQQGVVQAIEIASVEVETPLRRLELTLVPWTAFLIVPIFALSNAGVRVAGGDAGLGELVGGPVFWGVAMGLIVGKVIGVLGATWLAVRLGIGALPTGMTWRHVFGASWLAGIGFTMALFIANLAFKGEEGSVMLSQAKIAILGASALAGVVGVVVLAKAKPKADR